MPQSMSSRILSWLVVLGATVFAWTAIAQPLPHPSDRPILIVSGKIGVTNKGQTAEFDRSMLEALGSVVIETVTPWYDGTMKFEGVSLDKLMKRLDAQGETVVAAALNDYSSDIPMDDFAKHEPILALKRNGEYMTVRDKGPLFIIYPFDKNHALKSQTYYSRSVWQVNRLIIK
jgi:hypothetical protein